MIWLPFAVRLVLALGLGPVLVLALVLGPGLEPGLGLALVLGPGLEPGLGLALSQHRHRTGVG
jgi:hypothetical protein